MRYILAVVSILFISKLGFSTPKDTTGTMPKKDVRISLNSDGSHYLKFTGLGQYWLRYTDMNPGSRIYNTPTSSYTDMGLRRLRFQAFGQINKYAFFYVQFGLNNFTFRSPHYLGAFFHDALGEFKVKDEKLSLLDKETTWLLCSGDDIIWVINRRADNRFRVTENTKQILQIELK